MKETKRPPAPEVQEERVRVTGVQRILLEGLVEGPQWPKSLLRAKTYIALAEKGLAKEKADGSYEITQLGLEVEKGRKMGRPTKLTGPWLVLVNHYGGPERFSSMVGCAYNTVNRWALHGVKPTGAARRAVEKLATEAGLPNPFDVEEKAS